MNLQKCILTENRCYKTGTAITPKGVMVHSTGANNPNLKRYVGPDDGKLGKNQYGNHWNNANVNVCVHAFIGKLEDGSIATYQTLPWNMLGWHAGGPANNTHISFEICEDSLQNKEYFDSVYREAVEFTAYLCEKFGLDPLKDGVVIDHCEGCERGIASNHGDVSHWFPKFGKNMDMFREDVHKTLKFKDVSEVNVYKTFDDLPAWSKKEVESIIASGALKGDENGDINLTDELLRSIIISKRYADSLKYDKGVLICRQPLGQ